MLLFVPHNRWSTPVNVSLFHRKYKHTMGRVSAQNSFKRRETVRTKCTGGETIVGYRKKALTWTITSEACKSTKIGDNVDSSSTEKNGGSRTINIHKLQKYIGQLTVHATNSGSIWSYMYVVSHVMAWHQFCPQSARHVGTTALETAQKMIVPWGYKLLGVHPCCSVRTNGNRLGL